MFNSISGFLGFIAGVGLTIGLLLSPHLIPGGLGYGKGLFFSPVQTILLLLVYGIILAATLFFAGKLFNGAAGWKEPKVISGTVLIAFIANALYVSLVELFAWDEAKYNSELAGSAIYRIGHEQGLRNIAVALGNAPKGAAVIAALQSRAEHPSGMVREHVVWALAQHAIPNDLASAVGLPSQMASSSINK